MTPQEREVMQMALDALIDAADSQSWEMQQNTDQHGEWYRRSVYLKEAVAKSQEAIEALRAALAAPPEELDLPNVQLWQFLKMIEGKEDFRGIPLMRTEWPTREEALAQPEQEIESDRPHVEDDGCPTEKAVLQRFWREQQKQEPVAQFKFQNYGWWRDEDGKLKLGTMPEREWVGLTSEERLALWNGLECDLECMKPAQYAEAIEAKLKEKSCAPNK